MTHASPLVFVGIAPHPPIMVPEVGREATAEVRSSIDAMGDLTRRIIESGAQTVILISPHAPLEASAFVAYDGPKLYGDFSNFRAPTTTTPAELDEELLNEITRAAAEQELVVMRIRGQDFDHGTAVPLYFLQRNGWHGKVVALGYSYLSNENHLRFGRCVQRAVEKLGRPVAFIASGDLSHRLKRGAPAGYNAAAHLFDEEVVDAIRTATVKRIVDIDQEMRRTAGECGYRSMLVAIGAGEGVQPACEVISYEAPFGVGYLVAQLVAASSEAPPAVSEPQVNASEIDQTPELRDSITQLARRTIETFVGTGDVIAPPDDPPLELTARAGCFVSIKTLGGDLRGCIGTIDPVKDTLAEEIIWNAVSAATRDPRFSPVEKEELPNLKYSVDVMSAPEECTVADLDPKVFGVIVEDTEGLRRGLLLPNLAGITSAAHQVQIASRKAGISATEPVKLFRFSSQRYFE